MAEYRVSGLDLKLMGFFRAFGVLGAFALEAPAKTKLKP